MTQSFYIKFRNATLAYPSSAYNALTLKEELFKILRLKQRTRLLYDVVALKNVSLDIREGERVGVIGKNGAGKSTLLKAIAGLYPLQSGTVETAGKIRSLFELNLGFEIEATGRENIVYRGLLLGETPQSIKDKEAEIIDFAGLDEFIDYPIKMYSPGMLIRLAFAISTTIGGDILLLDEILAAGDAAFQAKARKRMDRLMEQAKMIVFVSHDLPALQQICDRAIYLHNGQIVADGKAESVIREYLASVRTGTAA
jgi:lipopolysaccharide transport system ATP-binding protein